MVCHIGLNRTLRGCNKIFLKNNQAAIMPLTPKTARKIPQFPRGVIKEERFQKLIRISIENSDRQKEFPEEIPARGREFLKSMSLLLWFIFAPNRERVQRP